MSDDQKVLALGLAGIVLAAVLVFTVFGGSFGFSGSGPRGIWKSTDGGETFQKANVVGTTNASSSSKPTTELDGISIRALTFAPDRTDVVYLTTPSGVYASDNAGAVWYHILSGVDISAIQVANTSPDVIYAVGTYSGRGAIYKSTNRGLSWEQTYTGSNSDVISAVAVNPYDANDVWAGLSSGTLLNSRDGGTNWATVRNFDSSINKLEFRPGDPRSFFMLLNNQGLYLTRDRANSFINITDNIPQGNATSNFFDSNAFNLNNSVVREDFVAPGKFTNFSTTSANPNVVYLVTNTGIFATNNLGSSWRYIKLPVDPRKASTVAVRASASDNLVYISVDSILFKSMDGGRSFRTLKLPSNRLVNVLMTAPGGNDIIYAGMR